jgi:protein-tyrosine phosphatase
MYFADIHIHALCNVDDGAKSEEEMLAMVEAAYADGARFLLLTPHCHPGYFGENRQRIDESFCRLQDLARDRFPDLKLALGNELRYHKGCVNWLREGLCRTLNDSRYILVDFLADEEGKFICEALEQLLNSGYVPILAHAERYRRLNKNPKAIRSLRQKGVLIQIDARAPLGGYGICVRRRSISILKEGLADFVASDAHNCKSEPPGLSDCHTYVKKRWGEEYADYLCGDHAKRLFFAEKNI